MATMNVSLPQAMKDWVESRTEGGLYANASDYIRDLIRRDQIKAEKIAHWQRLIDAADASGISDRTAEEVIDDARRKALTGRKAS